MKSTVPFWNYSQATAIGNFSGVRQNAPARESATHAGPFYSPTRFGNIEVEKFDFSCNEFRLSSVYRLEGGENEIAAS